MWSITLIYSVEKLRLVHVFKLNELQRKNSHAYTVFVELYLLYEKEFFFYMT